METKIKKLPKSQLEILIKLSKEEFKDFYEKAAFELGKNLELPGFRKGKIPLDVLEKNLDQRVVLDKAAETAIRQSYLKTILENKIEVLGRPKVEILKLIPKGSFEFKVLVSVFPEIKLADYKKIASQKKKKKISVSEKEIEETLFFIRQSRAKFFDKDLPAEKGDFIEIEYACSQLENSRKMKDRFFLGRGGFVAGFEEKLEGIKKGEEKDFSLKIPENYFQKSLAGKELNFKVKAIAVQSVEIPELNDEFARSLGKFETLLDLKKSIFEGIEMEKRKAESERIREEILKDIVENSEFEIPEILVEEEKNRYLEELKIRIPQTFRISFEDYLRQIKKTEGELKASYQKRAEEDIKRSLILREIKKREKIEASEEEILESANQILLNFTPEEAKKIDPNVLKEYTKERIEEEKVLNFLESHTK